MNEYKGHISFKCTWIKVKHHTAYFWMKAPFFHTECFEYISIIVEKQNMSNGDKRSAIIFKSFLGVCKIELFKQHIYRWNNPCSIENSKWRGTFMKYLNAYSEHQTKFHHQISFVFVSAKILKKTSSIFSKLQIFNLHVQTSVKETTYIETLRAKN